MGLLTDIAALVIQAAQKPLTTPKREVRDAFGLPCGVTRHQAPTKGGTVPFTLYRPADLKQNPPVFLNIHGGGYVMRAPEQDDHICRYIANQAACAVVNVDYDTAPQSRYPTAPEQCFQVAKWLAERGDQLDLDAGRIAVGGHSAGGALAAGVILRGALDGSFRARGLIVDYAILDLAADPKGKRQRLRHPLITPVLSRVFTDSYIPDVSRRQEPLASPILAPDFTIFPPTLVITAELDTLRDEGDAFAEKLRFDGVRVEHLIVPGVDHFFTHSGPINQARLALNAMALHLNEVFGPVRPSS